MATDVSYSLVPRILGFSEMRFRLDVTAREIHVGRLTEFTEEGLQEAIRKGVTYLNGGRCVAYKIFAPSLDVYGVHDDPITQIPYGEVEYRFVIVADGIQEMQGFDKPFTILFDKSWPHLVWQVSNGQAVGVPITEEALKANGALYTVQEQMDG